MRMSMVVGGIVALLVVAGVAIAVAVAGGEMREACDGIAAEMGGCDEDLPDFAGTTCGDVAREFSAEYSRRATDIFDGPPTVDDNSRSVRLIHLTNLLTQLANRHVRSVGLATTCDADAFFQTVEQDLTDEFKSRIAAYMYEDGSGTYEAWAQEVRTFLTILEEADEPAFSTPGRACCRDARRLACGGSAMDRSQSVLTPHACIRAVPVLST